MEFAQNELPNTAPSLAMRSRCGVLLIFEPYAPMACRAWSSEKTNRMLGRLSAADRVADNEQDTSRQRTVAIPETRFFSDRTGCVRTRSVVQGFCSVEWHSEKELRATFTWTAVRVKVAVVLVISMLLTKEDEILDVWSYCLSRPRQTVYSGMPLAQARIYTPWLGPALPATAD